MQNLYTPISLAAPTTTIVCAKPCYLSAIVVNKATATGVITVYNHPSAATGTPVATITSPATLLQNHFTLDYHDIYLDKGLTIVTATAAQDLTVAYRPN
jgi:hypothetical protein